MTTTTTRIQSGSIANYTTAIANLPPEAFLGSLLWFSISAADVELEAARQELTMAGISTAALPSTIRPTDAFAKVAREFGHKFDPEGGQRSELLVRSAGEDSERVYKHLFLERLQISQGGKDRRISFEKVGELVLTRGAKQAGAYTGFYVDAYLHPAMGTMLEPRERTWLETKTAEAAARLDHLCRFLDSHAVRNFVRETIYELNGVGVKESGGLYFVAQTHNEPIEALGAWVRRNGSQFHTLPLLNLVEQREMIREALEDEALRETERLMAEVKTILADPSRKISSATFDDYGLRAAQLSAKLREYQGMLGARADRAMLEIGVFVQQIRALAPRIRPERARQEPSVKRARQ